MIDRNSTVGYLYDLIISLEHNHGIITLQVLSWHNLYKFFFSNNFLPDFRLEWFETRFPRIAVNYEVGDKYSFFKFYNILFFIELACGDVDLHCFYADRSKAL